MPDDLYAEWDSDCDHYWICSTDFGTQIAVCREKEGKWYAAEYDDFAGEIGPFDTVDAVLDHIEKNHLFGPWGSLGM